MDYKVSVASSGSISPSGEKKTTKKQNIRPYCVRLLDIRFLFVELLYKSDIEQAREWSYWAVILRCDYLDHLFLVN